jgi:hypothetical protein
MFSRKLGSESILGLPFLNVPFRKNGIRAVERALIERSGL